MTITCERKKLVNFSTVYFNANQRILAARDSTISEPSDLSGKRVCVAKGTTSLQRIQQITPPPIIVGVVAWADCLVALQQRQADAVSTDDSILAGLVSQDPYLHIVGPEPQRGALRNRNQPAEHRAGALRQRHAGAHSARRHVEHVVPQVVNGARPGARTTSRKVFGLMAEAQSEEFDEPGAGTVGGADNRNTVGGADKWNPVGGADNRNPAGQSRRPGLDSVATLRPMATQAVFRPHFDDDSEGTRSGPATPNRRTTRLRRGRCRRRAASAVASWRSRACLRRTHSKR